MAPRRLLGCVCVAVLAVCAWTGCKDKDKPGQTGKAPSGADLMTRCEEVGKACGELDKHVQKIVEEKLGKGSKIEAFARFQIGK